MRRVLTFPSAVQGAFWRTQFTRIMSSQMYLGKISVPDAADKAIVRVYARSTGADVHAEGQNEGYEPITAQIMLKISVSTMIPSLPSKTP